MTRLLFLLLPKVFVLLLFLLISISFSVLLFIPKEMTQPLLLPSVANNSRSLSYHCQSLPVLFFSGKHTVQQLSWPSKLIPSRYVCYVIPPASHISSERHHHAASFVFSCLPCHLVKPQLSHCTDTPTGARALWTGGEAVSAVECNERNWPPNINQMFVKGLTPLCRIFALSFVWVWIVTLHIQTESCHGKECSQCTNHLGGCCKALKWTLAAPSSPRVQTMSFTHGNSPAISLTFSQLSAGSGQSPRVYCEAQSQSAPWQQKTLTASSTKQVFNGNSPATAKVNTQRPSVLTSFPLSTNSLTLLVFRWEPSVAFVNSPF